MVNATTDQAYEADHTRWCWEVWATLFSSAHWSAVLHHWRLLSAGSQCPPDHWSQKLASWLIVRTVSVVWEDRHSFVWWTGNVFIWQITSFIVYSQSILPQAVWFSGIIGKTVMQIWMILAAQHHWMSVILRLHHGYDHRDWLYASERNWDTTYMGDMHGRRPRGNGGDVAPPTSERHEVVSPNINYF